MHIVQTKVELEKEAEGWWKSQSHNVLGQWISKLAECVNTDAPERWRRYVIQRALGCQRPTFLAAYLWNRHAPPSKRYDIPKLLENPKGWTGFSQDFNGKEHRLPPLEPLGEPLMVTSDSYKLENPTKENTMNQFNDKAIAKPTLIFGRVADNMTEADFFSALEKLEKRKETLEIARGSGSSEYVNAQIQQVNNDIAAIIKTMDEVLG